MAATIDASKGAPCEDLPGSRIECPSHEPLPLSQITEGSGSPPHKLFKSHQPESLLKINEEGTEARFGIGPVASPKASLGSTLGLNEDFDKWIEGLGEYRNHRSDQEWVDTFLDDNSESIEIAKGTLQKPPKERLVALGYTSDKADEISAWIEAIDDDYREHNSLLDWAKTYTSDELQCGQEAPLFVPPKRPQSEWRSIDIAREGEGTIPSLKYQTNFIYLVNGQDNSYMRRNRVRYPPPSDDQYLYLYHATSQATANHILSGKWYKSPRKKDFSYAGREGFYMSTEFSHAWGWARVRPQRNALPAILVFKLKKEDLIGYHILHLNSNGFPEFTSGDTLVQLNPPIGTKAIWTEVIRLCRVGAWIRDDVYKVYKEHQAVHGYMCSNGGVLTSETEIEQHDPPKDQYCIIKPRMFHEIIWPNIDGVLYFAERL